LGLASHAVRAHLQRFREEPAMTPRIATFADNVPSLDEVDALRALKAGRTVISWSALPITVETPDVMGVALKFAFANATFETIVIDRYAADLLGKLFGDLETADWKILSALRDH
jgi:hypothetical protein